MKHCIMMTFVLKEDCREAFVKEAVELKSFWEEEGYLYSLYNDVSQTGRFIQYFLTNHSIEEFTRLIQENERGRKAIGELKGRTDKIIVTVMNQII